MTISTLDGFVGGAKQKLVWRKTATRTTVANGWFSMFGDAGNPGAGTWNVGNTANGLVLTDATAGFPVIGAFGGSAVGYLGAIGFSNTVVCRMRLVDVIFSCGAYNYNSNVTLASQPSFLGRVPGGAAANCVGLEIWAECIVAPTGNLAVNVTYTNDAGTASRTTGATGIAAAPTVGRMWQLPLQAGDKGVSLIQNVTCSVATVGASCVNVHVLRPLTPIVRVPIANSGDVFDFLKVGMPVMYDTSAIMAQICADGTSSGLPDWDFDIVNG